LQEGELQAGDEITKLATGPLAMTVAAMDGLLYLPRHPRRSLARALRIPALSEGWRHSFQILLDQDPGSGNQGLNPAAGSRPPWSRPDPPDRSGGSTARAVAPTTASPTRSTTSSPCSQTPTGSSATATQDPMTEPASISTLAGGSPGRCSTTQGSRRTAPSTCA